MIVNSLRKCVSCNQLLPALVAMSTRHFVSDVTAPDFDVLAEKYKSSKDSPISDQDKRVIEEMKENRSWLSAPIVYCDGSFEWNTKKGGIGIFWGPKDDRNVHLSLTGSKLTNIRAELQAVSLAALQAKSLEFNKVIIKTDSQFVVKVINSWLSKWRSNDWKKSDGRQVENMDDIKKLNEYSELIELQLEHTYGHQKFDENGGMEERWTELSCDDRDRCGNFHSDRLSRLGIESPMMTDEQFENKCISKLNRSMS